MLSAKKLAKKQKKAVARREETVRLILAARMAVKEVLEGVRRQRRAEELQRQMLRSHSLTLTGEVNESSERVREKVELA